MNFSIIQKSQLEEIGRLDAEYFQPEYLELDKSIKKQPFSTLEDFGCKVVSGPFGSSLKSEAYLEEGIPFIRISDLGDFFINDYNLIYISQDDNTRLKQSQLQPFDLVLSKVGNTIGTVSAISEELGICNISENNIGIKFHDPNLTLEHKLFLLTFLNSRLGYLQTIRSISGNAQPKLNINDVANLLVPIPQNSLLKLIKRLITEAKFSIDSSKRLYLQAEDLLLEELGLKNVIFEDELSYVVNLSDGKDIDRIDAEYFQPKYTEIIKKIKTRKNGWDILENLTSLIGHPTNPSYENNSSNNKTFIITQKHLSNYFPTDNFWEDSEALYTTDEFIRNNQMYLLKENDIILYSVGAYIGKANIYNSKNKATIGSFLTLIRPRVEIINPFYLLAFLNSPIGLLLTRRNSRGLAQQYIYPYDTKNIPIPKLSDNIQEEIEKLIKKGHEARKKSKELLEEAKRKVEDMVEKGES